MAGMAFLGMRDKGLFHGLIGVGVGAALAVLGVVASQHWSHSPAEAPPPTPAAVPAVPPTPDTGPQARTEPPAAVATDQAQAPPASAPPPPRAAEPAKAAPPQSKGEDPSSWKLIGVITGKRNAAMVSKGEIVNILFLGDLLLGWKLAEIWDNGISWSKDGEIRDIALRDDIEPGRPSAARTATASVTEPAGRLPSPPQTAQAVRQGGKSHIGGTTAKGKKSTRAGKTAHSKHKTKHRRHRR